MKILKEEERKLRIDTLKNELITTLNLYGEQSSKEIAEKINKPQKTITQLLSSLRRSGIVSRIVNDNKKNTGTWTIKKQEDKPLGQEEKPYPDLDKEHENWVKRVNRKKPKYHQ